MSAKPETLLLSLTQCEQCGARVTVISPGEVLACHCATWQPFLIVPHPAIAAVKSITIQKTKP